MPRPAWPSKRPAEQVQVLDGALMDGLELRRAWEWAVPLELRELDEMLRQGLCERVN